MPAVQSGGFHHHFCIGEYWAVRLRGFAGDADRPMKRYGIEIEREFDLALFLVERPERVGDRRPACRFEGIYVDAVREFGVCPDGDHIRVCRFVNVPSAGQTLQRWRRCNIGQIDL